MLQTRKRPRPNLSPSIWNSSSLLAALLLNLLATIGYAQNHGNDIIPASNKATKEAVIDNYVFPTPTDESSICYGLDLDIWTVDNASMNKVEQVQFQYLLNSKDKLKEMTQYVSNQKDYVWGWSIKYTNTLDSQDYSMEFIGNMGGAIKRELVGAIDGEIVQYQIFGNNNYGVLGLEFELDSGNLVRISTPTDGDAGVSEDPFALFDETELKMLRGPPVGFVISHGHSELQTAPKWALTPSQPLSVQIIINTCMCPSSDFLLPLDQIQDFDVTVQDITAVTKNLQFVDSVVNVYDQNCGDLAVTFNENLKISSYLSSTSDPDDSNKVQLILDPITDNSLVGIHEASFTVRRNPPADFIVGEGYFDDDSKNFVKEEVYQFTVTVNPCVSDVEISELFVDNVLDSSTEAVIATYTLGEDPLVVKYGFTNEPVICGNAETVTYDRVDANTDIPSFIVLDKVAKTITFKPTVSDTIEDKTYTFDVKISTQYITSATDSSIKTEVDSFIVTFKVVDPCDFAVIPTASLTFDDMFTTVLAGSPVLQDVTSKLPVVEGGFCEVRLRIKSDFVDDNGNPRVDWGDVLAYDEADVDNLFLSLQTDDENNVAIVTVTIEAYLPDYSGVDPVSATFTTTITTCVATSLTAQTTDAQVYLLEDPGVLKVIDVTAFTLAPACSRGIDYEFTLSKDGVVVPKPNFITKGSVKSEDLNANSNKNSDQGTYSLRISASTTHGPQTTFSDFELVVYPAACETEDFSPTGDQDITYILNKVTPFTTPVTLEWNTNVVKTFTCPAVYGFEIFDTTTTTWTTLSADQELVLTFEESDGSLSIKTGNLVLDAEVWKVRFTRMSVYSSAPKATHEVDITFRDECREAVLTPPEFEDSALRYSLAEIQQLKFSAMQSSITTCGGTKHELIYDSGPLKPFDLSSLYTLAGSQFEGKVIEKDWVGEHQLIVRGTLGTLDTSPDAPGNNGFYESVDSQRLRITVYDPCSTSAVNDDSTFPVTYAVERGQFRRTQTFSGPTDTVSQRLGNGYDVCGSKSYRIFNPVTLGDYVNQVFSHQVNPVKNQADEIVFALDSVKYGLRLQEVVRMEISLTGYPAATPAFLDVRLTWRECLPKAFGAAEINDLTVTSGDPVAVIDVGFDTRPCGYVKTYAAYLIDPISRQELALPSFIVFFPEEEAVVIDETKREDAGVYRIKIYCQLNNWAQSSKNATFVVQVLSDYVFVVDLPPIWEPKLVDQRIAVGQDLQYYPEIDVIELGYKYNLRVYMNLAQRYGVYNAGFNALLIEGRKVQKEDVGTYEIVFMGDFSRVIDEANGEVSNKFHRYTTSLWLTIYEPIVPPIVVVPIDGGEPHWNEEPMSNLIPVREGPGPVPYIESLSDYGLLRIGWDQPVRPLADFEKIFPDKKTAVRDWSAFDEEDVEARLELGYYKVWGEPPAVQLALIDSLELRILPADVTLATDPIEFTWQLVSYDSRFIEIQLEISNPQSIGESGEPDILSVTFWGKSYFSNQAGEDVLYGTELTTDIFRQISNWEAEFIDSMVALWWPPLMVIIGAAMIGAQLPAWIFINSLSLIVHTLLLNSLMPPSVVYTFKKYLHVVRLSRPDVNAEIEESWDVHQYSRDEGAFSVYLQTSDYVHLFARNLVIPISAALLLGIIWAIVATVDKVMKTKEKEWMMLYRPGKTKNEPYVTNFALRFFIQLFFEICICSLVNLALVDFEDTSPGFQWILSLLAMIGICVYLAWLVSLFFVNGPYLDNFYVKGTALQSIFHARPFNLEFNAILQADYMFNKRRHDFERARHQRTYKLAKVVPDFDFDEDLLFPPLPDQKKQVQISAIKLTKQRNRSNDVSSELMTDRNRDSTRPILLTDDQRTTISPRKDNIPLRQSMQEERNFFNINLQDQDKEVLEDSITKRKSHSPVERHSNDVIFNNAEDRDFAKSLADKQPADRSSNQSMSKENQSSDIRPLKESVSEHESSLHQPSYQSESEPSKQSEEIKEQQQKVDLQGQDLFKAELADIDKNMPRHSHTIKAFSQPQDRQLEMVKQHQKQRSREYFEGGSREFQGESREEFQESSQAYSDESDSEQNVQPSTAAQKEEADIDPLQRDSDLSNDESDVHSQWIDTGHRKEMIDGQEYQQKDVDNPEEPQQDEIDFFQREKEEIANVQRQQEKAREPIVAPARIDDLQQEIVRESAQEIVAGIDLVEMPNRYKTLYLGLHVNHPRNVAIVQPLMFALRRVIYALSIVFLPKAPLLGVWIMLGVTLIMLIYVFLEWQWKQRVISHQYVFNEFITYCVCVYLLMFQRHVSAIYRVLLGYCLLATFICFLVYNAIILIIILLHNLKLVLGRCSTLSLRKRLKKEALDMMEKIKAALAAMNKEKGEGEEGEEAVEDPFKFILQKRGANKDPIKLNQNKMFPVPQLQFKDDEIPKLEVKDDKIPKLEVKDDEDDSANWFKPNELNTQWKPVVTMTRTGGTSCTIVETFLPPTYKKKIDNFIKDPVEPKILKPISEDLSDDSSYKQQRHLDLIRPTVEPSAYMHQDAPPETQEVIEEEKYMEPAKVELIVERVVERVQEVQEFPIKKANDSVFDSSDGGTSSDYDGDSKGMFQPGELPMTEQLAARLALAQMAVENTITNVFGELLRMEKPILQFHTDDSPTRSAQDDDVSSFQNSINQSPGEKKAFQSQKKQPYTSIMNQYQEAPEEEAQKRLHLEATPPKIASQEQRTNIHTRQGSEPSQLALQKGKQDIQPAQIKEESSQQPSESSKVVAQLKVAKLESTPDKSSSRLSAEISLDGGDNFDPNADDGGVKDESNQKEIQEPKFDRQGTKLRSTLTNMLRQSTLVREHIKTVQVPKIILNKLKSVPAEQMETLFENVNELEHDRHDKWRTEKHLQQSSLQVKRLKRKQKQQKIEQTSTGKKRNSRSISFIHQNQPQSASVASLVKDMDGADQNLDNSNKIGNGKGDRDLIYDFDELNGKDNYPRNSIKVRVTYEDRMSESGRHSESKSANEPLDADDFSVSAQSKQQHQGQEDGKTDTFDELLKQVEHVIDPLNDDQLVNKPLKIQHAGANMPINRNGAEEFLTSRSSINEDVYEVYNKSIYKNPQRMYQDDMAYQRNSQASQAASLLMRSSSVRSDFNGGDKSKSVSRGLIVVSAGTDDDQIFNTSRVVNERQRQYTHQQQHAKSVSLARNAQRQVQQQQQHQQQPRFAENNHLERGTYTDRRQLALSDQKRNLLQVQHAHGQPHENMFNIGGARQPISPQAQYRQHTALRASEIVPNHQRLPAQASHRNQSAQDMGEAANQMDCYAGDYLRSTSSLSPGAMSSKSRSIRGMRDTRIHAAGQSIMSSARGGPHERQIDTRNHLVGSHEVLGLNRRSATEDSLLYRKK